MSVNLLGLFDLVFFVNSFDFCTVIGFLRVLRILRNGRISVSSYEFCDFTGFPYIPRTSVEYVGTQYDVATLDTRAPQGLL